MILLFVWGAKLQKNICAHKIFTVFFDFLAMRGFYSKEIASERHKIATRWLVFLRARLS